MHNLINRNPIKERRGPHFKQKRHRKMSASISNYLYDACVRSQGLLTSMELQLHILFLFDLVISPVTIRKQLHLMSNSIIFYENLFKRLKW